MIGAARSAMAGASNQGGAAGYRHLKLDMSLTNSGAGYGGTLLVEAVYRDALAQRYPSVPLTSNTAPAPFVTSRSGTAATGAAYLALDQVDDTSIISTAGAFHCFNATKSGILLLDLGVEVFDPAGGTLEIRAISEGTGSYTVSVYGSATGAFSGEEDLLLDGASGSVPDSNWGSLQVNTHNF